MSFGFDSVGFPIATIPNWISDGWPPTYDARSCRCIARETMYCLTAFSSGRAPTRFCSLGDRRWRSSSIRCPSTSSGAVQTSTTSGASSIKPDKLGLRLSILNGEARHTRLEVEPPRSRRARVDHQPAADSRNELPVSVSVHDYLFAVCGSELRGRRSTNLVAVGDPDVHAAMGNDDRRRQAGVVGCVRVSVNRLHRRYEPQLLEDVGTSNIACVKNEVHALQRIVDGSAHHSMGVRDEADNDAVGVGGHGFYIKPDVMVTTRCPAGGPRAHEAGACHRPDPRSMAVQDA